MSTISCELFQHFDDFNWVGFYRHTDSTTLKVGPYQGTHGCLVINIDRGVCGKCAKENQVQLVRDVHKVEHHIACSSETQSEIVLPITNKNNVVQAVLDIDATKTNCFDEIDQKYLEIICNHIQARY